MEKQNTEQPEENSNPTTSTDKDCNDTKQNNLTEVKNANAAGIGAIGISDENPLNKKSKSEDDKPVY